MLRLKIIPERLRVAKHCRALTSHSIWKMSGLQTHLIILVWLYRKGGPKLKQGISLRKNQEGITTLILLMLLSVVSIFIITLIQSRIILSLRRSLSAADTILSTYAAESEINDVLARIVGGYENVGDLDDYEKDLIDGSHLIVDFATTQRPYAVSKIKAERTIPREFVTTAENIEIVLVMDCTGSMGSKARQGSQTTRFYEQREAVKSFVKGVMDLPDSDRFTLGVVVYGYTTSWYKDASGAELKSLSGMANFQKLYNEAHSGFGNPPETDLNIRREDTRCPSLVEDYTNTGAGLRKAEDYFNDINQDVSKAIVLVTDGIPNSKTKDSFCPNNINCHGSNAGCFDDARDYLRCRIADSGSQYLSEVSNRSFFGVRDPNVKVYAVTVLDSPKNNEEEEIFTKTVGIFSQYSNSYYNLTNATQLTQILESFLEEIIKENSVITIERIIPGQ